MESKEEREQKKERKGRTVASLPCDRAPKGSRDSVCESVCVCVVERVKMCVSLQGCVSCTWVREGAGQGGGGGRGTIYSWFFPFCKSARGSLNTMGLKRFSTGGKFSLSSVDVNRHAPHCKK